MGLHQKIKEYLALNTTLTDDKIDYVLALVDEDRRERQEQLRKLFIHLKDQSFGVFDVSKSIRVNFRVVKLEEIDKVKKELFERGV